MCTHLRARAKLPLNLYSVSWHHEPMPGIKIWQAALILHPDPAFYSEFYHLPPLYKVCMETLVLLHLD